MHRCAAGSPRLADGFTVVVAGVDFEILAVGGRLREVTGFYEVPATAA